MAALTADRKTARRNGKANVYPVSAAAVCFAGGMVGINTSGFAVAASAIATLKVVGICQEQVTGASPNGTSLVTVFRDPAYLANSTAGDLITLADVGADCYAADDQTVAKTSATNTRPRAGKIINVDANGVLVEF